jgi:hypothetical protein
MSDKRTGKKTKKLALASGVAGETGTIAEVPATYVAVKAKKSHRK